MLPKAINVATSVEIGTTRTSIQARLNVTSLMIIHVSSPFPISLSANFIINCSRNINISDMTEKINGRKWFLSIYLYKIMIPKYEKRKGITRR
jgi:hypothetical protein